MNTPSLDGIHRRLERLKGQRIRSGLLSPEGAAALTSVGFEPICEVLGAVVNTVTPTGFYSSGYRAPVSQPRSSMSEPPSRPATRNYKTYTSSSHSVAVGVPLKLTAFRDGYRTAINRLIAEAVAAGADGVVDLRIEHTVGHLSGVQRWSFLAVGTAIRSTGRVRSTTPFTTDFGAVQMAAAIGSGWMPISYLMVPCMAIRAIDPVSRIQTQRLSSNGEITAYTELVNTCRHQARTDFHAGARAVGADAAVQSAMTLSLELEHHDAAVAQVNISGTALAQFSARARNPRSLTIIPLR